MITGPGQLHRGHQPPRHAARGGGALARRRTPRSPRSTPPPRRSASGVVAVLTGEDMAGDFAGPLPMVWAPPGVEIKTPEHWPLKRGEVKHVGDPVAVVVGDDASRRRRRRRGRDRRLRPEARRGGPGGGARGRLAARLGGVRHQQDARVGGRRRRHRRRPRRGRGHGRAPLREPPHLGRADRAALLGRRGARRRPHAVLDDPDPAHRALRLLRHARHRRGQAARGRPRRRRRLRREAPDLRRGGARRSRSRSGSAGR